MGTFRKIFFLFCLIGLIGQTGYGMNNRRRKRSKSCFKGNSLLKKDKSSYGRRLSPKGSNFLSPLSSEPPLIVRSLSRGDSFFKEEIFHEPAQGDKRMEIVIPLVRRNTMAMLDKGVQVDGLAFQKKQKHEIMQGEFFKRNRSIDFDVNPVFDLATVNGISMMFDLRGFTKFCGELEQAGMSWAPAVFIKELLGMLSCVVKSWRGTVVSVTGDGFLAVFPKKKGEDYTRAVKLAVLCAIEVIYAVSHFRCKIRGVTIDGPRKCGIGLQMGPNYFFNIERHDSQVFDIISDVSNTVNISQRYENYSKTISKNMQKYMPLVVPVEILNLLTEDLKDLFRQSSPECGSFVRQEISFRGVKEPVIVYSGYFKKIENFYSSNKEKLFCKNGDNKKM
ncbi:adenylate/guanylate cyclase domain-containing protein [Candidatus Dependentiae bacterium]|nr:adenylate/guanylate cyclase domain-containing protein [Candidatus Dependentiae bacterium]